MTFSELDDFMVENGYYSIFFEGVIKDLKKYSSIIYEEEQKEEESIWDEAFKKEVNEDIIFDKNSHLMGAIGVAILARKSKIERKFDFRISDIPFETKGIECKKCSNHCEIICVYRDKKLLDAWGNKCENGNVTKMKEYV